MRIRTFAVLLLVLAGTLLFWQSRPGVPDAQPPRDAEAGPAAKVITTGTHVEEATGASTDLVDPGRQPIAGMVAGGEDTSLFVRVVDRTSGESVPNMRIGLYPKHAVPFAAAPLRGLSDQQGEVRWENVQWNEARISPPFTEEALELFPGHNEHVHEVELVFTIRGQVVDSRGQGVAEAEVWQSDGGVLSEQDRVAVADVSGAFSLPVYGSASANVFARLAGRGPSRTALVSKGEGPAVVRLRLTLGDQVGSIIGEVVTPDGEPVTRAEVRVRGSKAFLPPQEDPTKVVAGRTDQAPISPPLRTGESGQFRFDDVPLGEAVLTVMADGFAGSIARVDVIAAGTSRVRIPLQRGARVVGSLRDSAGEPVEGVTVVSRYHTFAVRHAVSDAQGHYRIENAEPGRVMLEATHPLRGEFSDTVDLADGQELRWEPSFGAAGGIQGTILHADGTPMADRPVLIRGDDGDWRRENTDGQGRFAILYCKDQPYEVGAYPQGISQPITVAEGVRPSDAELTLRLPQLPSADASLTGKVVRSNGRPASEVRITARETEYFVFQMTHTEPDGRFTLGPSLSGEWSVTFESDHPKHKRTVILDPGETRDLGEIRLSEAVPVEVSVHGAEGVQTPVYGLLQGEGYDSERVPVESGRALLPPLEAGQYRLDIRGTDLAWSGLNMDLAAGESARFEITLVPGVIRNLEIVLPEGQDSASLRFQTLNRAGEELASWTRTWFASWGAQPMPFRPEATHIRATSDNGSSASAELGPGNAVRLEIK